MRVLIPGGDGMLGHQLLKSLAPRHVTKVTLRQDLEAYKSAGLFNEANSYAGVDVRSLDRLTRVLADFRPDAVINAVGIVKQRPAASENIPVMEINAIFPHRLSALCKAVGARLVHMSTDCVFSGRKGNYRETDPSDAEDLYGRSKFLGELQEKHCLTLRTSIIGRELAHKHGLLEWFLSQHGMVKGFKNAIFTGFTTLEMGRIIEDMLTNHPKASGVYHVSSNPVSKYDLLLLFRKTFDRAIEIEPDEAFSCDRSLDSTRFREEFGYAPPAWDKMVEELRTGA
jgi:dTDP-4-dehydrorhamnose reductase